MDRLKTCQNMSRHVKTWQIMSIWKVFLAIRMHTKHSQPNLSWKCELGPCQPLAGRIQSTDCWPSCALRPMLSTMKRYEKCARKAIGRIILWWGPSLEHVQLDWLREWGLEQRQKMLIALCWTSCPGNGDQECWMISNCIQLHGGLHIDFRILDCIL